MPIPVEARDPMRLPDRGRRAMLSGALSRSLLRSLTPILTSMPTNPSSVALSWSVSAYWCWGRGYGEVLKKLLSA